MSRIAEVAASERDLNQLLNSCIFYLQRVKQGNVYSPAEREQAIRDIEGAMPLIKRYLWKIKNLTQPL